MNGADDHDSTPDGAPGRMLSQAELGKLYEAIVLFIEGMAAAKAAWDAAPRDDHAAGTADPAAGHWGQWEAAGYQLDQVVQLMARLDGLLADFLDRDGALDLAALERPLRTLCDQLVDLRNGKVGPLLVPRKNKK